MSISTAEVSWVRGEARFTDNRYSRQHTWRFDGGVEVLASSSPQVVPVPLSNPAGVDPEEAFVASLSSCHMLWFLSLAAQAGYTVDRYDDAASGVLEKNAHGRLAMTVVTLRPKITFIGPRLPTAEALRALHEAAHDSCFIAQSVLTEVRCEPRD